MGFCQIFANKIQVEKWRRPGLSNVRKSECTSIVGSMGRSKGTFFSHHEDEERRSSRRNEKAITISIKLSWGMQIRRGRRRGKKKRRRKVAAPQSKHRGEGDVTAPTSYLERCTFNQCTVDQSTWRTLLGLAWIERHKRPSWQLVTFSSDECHRSQLSLERHMHPSKEHI